MAIPPHCVTTGLAFVEAEGPQRVATAMVKAKRIYEKPARGEPGRRLVHSPLTLPSPPAGERERVPVRGALSS